MHKKLRHLLFLLMVVGVGTVAGIAVLRAQGQGQQMPKQDDGLTERQREHSKLYREYETSKKISELVVEIGDVKIRRNTPLSGDDLGGHAADSTEFLRAMTCDADAIVIGKIQNKFSQLTESGDFIFTDYQMTVSEVLKDQPTAHIQPETNVTITRPGGMIRMNGRTVEAIDNAFEPFALEGHYLLFLRFIPVTGAYKAVGSKSSFQLHGKAINKLTKEASSLDSVANCKDVDSVVNEIRIALGGGCTKVSIQ